MLHPHQHYRGGLRQVPHDRGPQPAGGYRGQRSTILAAAWRVASAVTPAPPGQATAASTPYYLVPAMLSWLMCLVRPRPTQSRRRADPYCAKQDEYAISQPKPNPLRHLRHRPLYASRKRPRIENSPTTGMASRSGGLTVITRPRTACLRALLVHAGQRPGRPLPVSRHIPVGAARLTHATHTLATRGRLAAHRAGAI